MSISFMPGDVVRLRSGGLSMTVVEIDGRNISCQWLDANGMLQAAVFSVVVLEKDEPSNSTDQLLKERAEGIGSR